MKLFKSFFSQLSIVKDNTKPLSHLGCTDSELIYGFYIHKDKDNLCFLPWKLGYNVCSHRQWILTPDAYSDHLGETLNAANEIQMRDPTPQRA